MNPAFSFRRSYISIHAPRTGSDADADAAVVQLDISIHAPRTGSDNIKPTLPYVHYNFNPRSPHGERLQRLYQGIHDGGISIHAPRTGSDWHTSPRPSEFQYFNPRSPHGERQPAEVTRGLPLTFQSTLPARGATDIVIAISIARLAFQSTLPARGATVPEKAHIAPVGFQSTLPARGATRTSGWRHSGTSFQSTLPARGAT